MLVSSTTALAYDTFGWSQATINGSTATLNGPSSTNNHINVTAINGGQSGTGKSNMYSGNGTSYTVSSTSYRDMDDNNKSVKSENDAIYFGYTMTVEDGYSLNLGQLDWQFAMSQNFSYRIEITDDEGNVKYNSTAKTATNYSKSSATDITGTTGLALSGLTGTVTLKVYYWYTVGSGSKYIAPFLLQLTGTVTEPTKYNISFNLNSHGGNASGGVYSAVSSAKIPTDLPEPTAYGYTFGGWFTDQACTQQAVAGTLLTSDINLYAKWTLTNVQNTLTLSTSEGTITKTTYDGNDILLPSAYTESEEVSEGTWSSDAHPSGSLSGYSELYSNGYSTAAGAALLTQTLTGLTDGATYEITLNAAASFTNSRGFTTPTGDNLTVAYAGDQQISIPVLDRTWVESDEIQTITFTVQPTNGSITFGLKNIAESGNWFIAKVESIKKITPGTFKGWYTDATEGTKVGVAGDAYTITDNSTTLYAHWQTAEHTVSFDIWGGTGTTPDAVTAEEGTEITLPNPSLTIFGSTFWGWTDGTSNIAAGGKYTVGTSDVTLRAVYTLNSVKSVNFDANGNSVSTTSLREPVSGEKILLPEAYSSYATPTSSATWSIADNVINNGSYSGITGKTFQEAYYSFPVGVGNVITKTETGLSNGTYEIIMSVGASYTQRNGVDACPTGNDLTYAFAGDKEISIPVINRTWITAGQENIVALTVEVTDGTLTYGIKNKSAAGNWYIINIESLRKVDNSNFEGWYTAADGGTKVGDAGDEYAIGTDGETLYAHWSAASGDAIVLEQRGTPGSKNGTFTNSTCTVNQSISNENSGYADAISPLSTLDENTKVYYSGGITTITVGLNSTSASEIVIGGVSIADEARLLSSISVNGTELDATTYNISGTFPSQSGLAFGRVTITGLEIAQGSEVTFNFSGKIRVAYFEVTPYSASIKSSNTNLQSVTVHGMTLTADATGNYIYNIGTGYGNATIDMLITPSDNTATINGAATTGAQTQTMTIGTVNTVNVMAEDGTEKEYTVTVNRVPLTTLPGTKLLVSSLTKYYEAQQCTTSDGAITATIPATYGYAEIYGVTRSNYANTNYTAYGVTDAANAPSYNESGIPTDGVFYRFDTNGNGYINMGIKLDKNHQLKVIDGEGNDVSFSSRFMTSEVSEVEMTGGIIAEDATGIIEFNVETGKTYYVYSVDSPLGYMGFIYTQKSSDATASFKLDGNDITFTNGGYDVSDTYKASGQTYAVNIVPADKATVTSVTNATATGNTNEYTITVPAEGSSVSAVFTITAEDGTTKDYTIRITKKQNADTRFHLTMTSASDHELASGTSVELNGTYADVTGGTATLYNNADYDATLISKDAYAALSNSSQYIKIDLNGYTLKEGDVIKFTQASGLSTGEICFTTEATKNDSNGTVAGSFTIASGSDLIGKSSIYVWRVSSAAFISELEIVSPLISVSINNTVVVCQGGTGTAGDPKVYTYDVPRSYTDTTVPVTIITTGTLSESITSLASPAVGTPTEKEFHLIPAGSSEKEYYKIVLNRTASSDCSLIAATAKGVAANISGETVQAEFSYNSSLTDAEDVAVTITIPDYATVTWQDATTNTSNTISLPAAVGSSNSKTFTITAEDGVTTKAYTFTLYRKQQAAYLVTTNEQVLYLKTADLANDVTDNFWSISNKGNGEITVDGEKANYYTIKNTDQYITVAEKGATAARVTIYSGGADRKANIYSTDDTSNWGTATELTSVKGLTTSKLITLASETDKDEIRYIKIAGTGSDIYVAKITFYTGKVKQNITLAYSAESWDGSSSQPALTAKDEEDNVVDLSALNVSYSSDDERVATVADDGTITVDQFANGSATIYVSTAETDDYYAASTSLDVIKLQGYSYNMKDVGDTYTDADGYTKNDKKYKPNVGQKIYLKDDEDNILVTGTFGGWELNSGTYEYTSGKTVTDDWNNIGGVGDFAPVDGYKYQSSGVNDARDESLKEEFINGETMYGAFHEAEKDASGNITTYPFTLPCRGTYMTYEPTVNGTLSIYILQNGAWGNDEPIGQFRKHAFFLTDQNGRSISDYTEFTATVKNKVTAKWHCALDAYGNAADADSANIGNWAEFQKYFSQRERLAVQAAWSSGTNGAEKVIVLDNGSFLITQKACVKYTFYAVAGQTYYLFANKSKMGFCGMNFIPDETEKGQPSKELDLSENIKYDSDAIAADGEANGEAKTTNVALPQYSTVTLDRKFTKDYWNTLCIPFTMTAQEVVDNFGEDAEVIILDNITVDANNIGHLHFTYHEIQQIIAGYPYLIKPGKDSDGITVKNKTVDPDTRLKAFSSYGYISKGIDGFCNPVITSSEDPTKTGYSYKLKSGDVFLSNGQLWVSKGKSYLKGYRTYLEAPADESSQAKKVVFDYKHAWEEAEEATQIDVTELAPDILDAFGITTAGVYNMNGQRIAETATGLAKGIYIVNGKKMIVK